MYERMERRTRKVQWEHIHSERGIRKKRKRGGIIPKRCNHLFNGDYEGKSVLCVHGGLPTRPFVVEVMCTPRERLEEDLLSLFIGLRRRLEEDDDTNIIISAQIMYVCWRMCASIYKSICLWCSFIDATNTVMRDDRH